MIHKSAVVHAFGEELEIEKCPTCNGTGNAVIWNRETGRHEENKNFFCETCKGARYVVVSHWKKR